MLPYEDGDVKRSSRVSRVLTECVEKRYKCPMKRCPMVTKNLDRSIALLAILLFAIQWLLPAMLLAAQGPLPSVAQAGPRQQRGTQIGQGGRPMIVECDADQPCRFVSLFDPGVDAVGPIVVDPATAVTCTPGVCGTPVPFQLTPAVLAPTSVAAATGGLSAGTLIGVAAATTIPFTAALATAISTTIDDPVQTGSR